MIRVFLSLAAVAAVVALISLNSIAGEKSAYDIDAVRAGFVERFPQIKPESIHPGPVEGFLEIRQGTMVAFLSDDGRYLFQGDLIDLVTETNLTDSAASVERKVLMQSVSADQQIVFGPDKPIHSISIFTDIDCGFCRKLHREIADYAEQGIEIKYLMYPRSGPNTESWQKAEDVACAQDPTRAITLAKNDQLVVSKACDLAKTVADSYKLGGEIGLRGTPAIVLESGELISGYVAAKDLRQRLDLIAKSNVEK